MKLKEIAISINADLIGNPEKEISLISDIKSISQNGILFLSNSKIINDNDISQAGAILTNKVIASSLQNKNILISDNPKLSFALLTHLFFKPSGSLRASKEFESYPLLGKNVKLGKNPCLGHNIIIEDDVSIGDNALISHNVVIHRGVKIGNNVTIGAGSIIGSEGFGNIIDPSFNWHHINHIGSVQVGNNVSIGTNCSIDRGTLSNTIIENKVIMDNNIHIAHNVKIGESTAIAANTGIAGSCVIGKRNLIGGMVGIVDHITTVDDVVISAKSTVYKNLLEPGTYSGIMPITKHSLWKGIALLITKLDKIQKILKK